MQALHRHITALDGLRAVFVLFVVVGHSRIAAFVPGGAGVTALFVISGFLVVNRLINGGGDSSNSLSSQLWRRFRNTVVPVALYLAISTIFVEFAAGRVSWRDVFIGIGPYANYYKIFVGFEHVGGVLPPSHILWPVTVLEHCY